jgi:histidinol-phosphate/aromatic aminotransferase/cobyric acid decarboxylase-like protein
VSGAVDLPEPGEHGGDAVQVAHALGLDPDAVVDLSASLNPFAPDVVALAAATLQRQPGSIRRYPDADAATNSLAGALGVDPDRVVLTNGGAEAIALVAAELRSGHVVDPEFSLYRRHLATVDKAAPRWRSNPSNPLGQLAGPDEQAGVWDEAFYPLATGRWSRGDHEAWRVGSLTKLWACPGLRLGYVIAPDGLAAAALRRHQPAWPVNGLALALMEPLLAQTDLAGWAHAIAALRTAVVGRLGALGYEVTPTEACWVLVRSPDLRRRLAGQGVVVRDCASFGLPAGTHRVALPRPDQLDAVVEAFAAAATIVT